MDEVITADPSTWPKVGDPALGYVDAPDCPATDAPDGFPFACTRDAGHPMPHVADGLDQIVHVWVGEDDIRAAARANPDQARALLATLFDDPDGGA